MSDQWELYAYLDVLYDCDEQLRLAILNTYYERTRKYPSKMASFITGSLKEGSYLVPLMIQVENKDYDLDMMMVFENLPEDRSRNMMMETEYPGYYLINVDDDQISRDFDEKSISFLKGECSIKDVRNNENKFLDFFEVKKGCPSVTGRLSDSASELRSDQEIDESVINNPLVKVVLHMMVDLVFSLQINFWPEITAEWFTRDRYWPDPRTICEIREAGCSLVRKAVGSEERTWRLSFSEAEVILASQQTRFQKMSYLLAKVIFTLETHALFDGETDRKLSSYLLKTVYLFTIEETQPEDLEQLERANDYLIFVAQIFRRLSGAFKTSYLPCYFAREIDLLHGFDRNFLNDVACRFENIFQLEFDILIKKLVQNFKECRLYKIFSAEPIQTTP